MWIVKTFGSLDISFDGISFGRRLSGNTKLLVALLAINHGRCLLREEIAEKLWSCDYDRQCQRRLSTILWRLECGYPVVPTNQGRNNLLHRGSNGAVSLLVDSNMILDLAEFQSIFARLKSNTTAMSDREILEVERAVDLYNGDLFRDFAADWLYGARSHAQQCYLEMLQVLIDHFEHKCVHDKVCDYAERFINSDPFVENVHISLMNAYAAKGQRNMAAARARTWQRILIDELGEHPSVETADLMLRLTSFGQIEQRKTAITRRDISRPNSANELRHTLEKLISLCHVLKDELEHENRLHSGRITSSK